MIDKGISYINRKNFAGGADMGTVADSQGNVGPGAGGYQGGGTQGVDRSRVSAAQEAAHQQAVRSAQRENRIRDMERFIDRPKFGFTDAARINLFNPKNIFSGIMGLINPGLGLATRGLGYLGDKFQGLRDYDTLADYARGEFGLFQDEDEDEEDVLTGRDLKGFTPSRMGIMNPDVRPTQMFNFDPTQFNTRNRNLGELVAEITQKDIDASKARGFKTLDRDTAVTLGLISPNVTEYEFEQLKQGNITEPGTYIG